MKIKVKNTSKKNVTITTFDGTKTTLKPAQQLLVGPYDIQYRDQLYKLLNNDNLYVSEVADDFVLEPLEQDSQVVVDKPKKKRGRPPKKKSGD